MSSKDKSIEWDSPFKVVPRSPWRWTWWLSAWAPPGSAGRRGPCPAERTGTGRPPRCARLQPITAQMGKTIDQWKTRTQNLASSMWRMRLQPITAQIGKTIDQWKRRNIGTWRHPCGGRLQQITIQMVNTIDRMKKRERRKSVGKNLKLLLNMAKPKEEQL